MVALVGRMILTPAMLLNVVASLLIFSCVGCGNDRAQVFGKVLFEDGSPLDGGTVVAEATVEGKLVSAQSNIEPDGSYRLGGSTAGDGALPGSYQFAVMPIPLSDAELGAGKKVLVPGKYSNLSSSGIKLDVKPGENPFDIKITKAKDK